MNSSTTLNYGINFSVNPPKFLGDLNNDIEEITKNTQKMSGSFGGCWRQLLSINQALEGVRNLTTLLDSAIQPGNVLNASLTDLSAITGLTGKALEGINEAAKTSARVFGTDAAQNVESYKLLLSQLSPDIAKSSEALKLMGDHVNILSKTMDGNTVAATEVLTTAMNQYGVSLTDPMQASKIMAEMMNVMAAAAKEGSAELPQIKSALENVGMVAKTTGVTFSETNAAIQVLDKAGKKGAEGGVALRNTLSILSEGRFLPKQTQAALEDAGISIARLADQTNPLTARLSALKPIMHDTALITKLFGKENAAAAIALINGSEEIDEYNRRIQNTNTAVDQAKIVMGSYQEQMKRTAAFFNNLKIGLFELTQGALSYIQVGASLMVGIGQITSGIAAMGAVTKVLNKICLATVRITKSFIRALRNGTLQTRLFATWQGIASFTSRIFSKSITGLRNAFFWATGAVRTFSLAVANIPVLGWIAIAVGAITAAVIYLWDHCRKFRGVVYGIWEVCKLVFRKIAGLVTSLWTNTIKPTFSSIGNFIGGIFNWIGEAASAVWTGMITGIQNAWACIGNFFTSLWQGFENMFSGFAGFIDAWIVQPIAGAFSGLWTIIAGVFNSIWSGLKTLFVPIISLWSKIFPDDGLKEIRRAFQVGEQKGGKLFDDSKKEKNTKEGEDDKIAAIPALSKLQTSKSGLKSFGSMAATSAKNTQSKSDKLHGLSTNSHSSGSRNLTINKLVETLIVKVERLPESKERIKDAVAEALLLAVNDYNLAT
ncbi:MAG: phage tail tape measure protein [Pedobacter sp.]|jgi:TP901 family phage tail tape measure protein|nr:MAG: phage tail tape measure protein [Pedobacter sp.]